MDTKFYNKLKSELGLEFLKYGLSFHQVQSSIDTVFQKLEIEETFTCYNCKKTKSISFRENGCGDLCIDCSPF